jgi:hypothetical protein
VDGAVNSAAAQERAVGRVYNRIHIEFGDVASHKL